RLSPQQHWVWARVTVLVVLRPLIGIAAAPPQACGLWSPIHRPHAAGRKQRPRRSPPDWDTATPGTRATGRGSLRPPLRAERGRFVGAHEAPQVEPAGGPAADLERHSLELEGFASV